MSDNNINTSQENSNANIVSRGDRRLMTIFSTSANKKKEAILKNVELRTGVTRTKLERTTPREIIFFIIYATIFFIVAANQLQVGDDQTIFEAMAKIFLNKVRIGDTYQPVNPAFGTFDEISNFQSFVSFILPLVSPSFYASGDPILINEQYINAFRFLQPFTSWRVVQTRVEKVPGYYKCIDFKWDPSGKESKEPFGINNTFQYSEADGGFPLYFDVPLFSTNTTEGIAIYEEATINGYFDTFTQTLTMDGGIYSSSMEKACYVRVTASITATGYLQTYLESKCFEVDIYATASAKFQIVLELIFVSLTVYYVIIDVLKIINSIRNERLKMRLTRKKPKASNMALTSTLADRALTKCASGLKGLISGFLGHIQNLWSFLDFAMIILISICIVKWVIYVKQNSLKTVLDKLTIEPNQYVIKTDSDLATFRSLMLVLSSLSDDFDTYYRCCALAGFIIILKLLKYMTSIFKNLRELVSFVMRVISRIIPFIILLLTILVAFSLSSFYFYGHLLVTFSSLEKSFFYTMQNILQNYDSFEDMSAINYGFTFVYLATFSFIVIFIMSKMFLIYTMAEYRKFVQQRDRQRKLEKEESQIEDRVHFVTRIMRFAYKRIYLKYLQCCNKRLFAQARAAEEAMKYESSMELLSGETYNVKASINETIHENQNRIKTFSNDVLREKYRQKANKNFVQVFWTTIAVIFMFIVFSIVANERNKVSIAADVGNGIQTLFTGFTGFSPTSLIRLDYLNSVAQLKIWIKSSFPSLILPKNVSIYDNNGNLNELSGYFLNEYLYVINQEIGVTVRRKNASLTQDGKDLTVFCNVSLPAYFKWNAGSPQPDEFTGDIKGTVTNTNYAYLFSKPGYFTVLSVGNYTTQLTNLIEDGLIDSSLNSVLFDIALYHVVEELPIYIQIVLTIDAAGNINNVFNTQVINTPKTNGKPSAQDIFTYSLEVILVIAAIYYIYHAVYTLKTKSEMYSHWYELYIHNFPTSVKRKRENLKPEFLRRLEFILSGEYSKILFTVFLVIDIALTATIFVVEVPLQKKLDFVVPSALAKNSQPFPYQTETLIQKLQTVELLGWYLRLIDSITLLIAIKNLFYQYSFNILFYRITKTFKRMMSDLLFMIAIHFTVLFGFAYFLLPNVGVYDSDFSNVFFGFRELLDSLTGIKEFDIINIRSFKDLFVSIFFFYPYAIIGRLILANIFIGIVYSSYARSKKETIRMERTGITISEFFSLTRNLICKKRKINTSKFTDISEDMKDMANLHNVIDLFSENLPQENVKGSNINIWSALCSKYIINEYEARKKIRKKAKEYVSMHVGEEENTLLPTHFQSFAPEIRLKEYNIRELYWNYFRIGIRKLMFYFKILDQKLKSSQERVKIDHETQLKEETIEKLKKYIKELEAKIEANISDLHEIRRVFKLHEISEPDEEDEDNNY